VIRIEEKEEGMVEVRVAYLSNYHLLFGADQGIEYGKAHVEAILSWFSNTARKGEI